MRYQVNQVLPVIGLKYVGAPDNGRLFFAPYMPWNNTALESICFEHLTVMEHHRVLNEYAADDDVPDCDGYLLKSEDGKLWGNQYPRACYGQISNLQDFIFERKLEEGKFQEWMEENPTGLYSYRLLTDYLKALKHGIYKRNEETQTDSQRSETELLQAHFDRVVSEYETTFNKKLVFEKRMVTSDVEPDKPRWVKGWWKITIVDNVPESASESTDPVL